jgi:hypothetical protein
MLFIQVPGTNPSNYDDFKSLARLLGCDFLTYSNISYGADGGSIFSVTALSRENPIQIFWHQGLDSTNNAPQPSDFATDFPEAIEIASGATSTANAIGWILGTRQFAASDYDDFKVITNALCEGGVITYFAVSSYFQVQAMSYGAKFLVTFKVNAAAPSGFATDFPGAIALDSWPPIVSIDNIPPSITVP